MREARAPQELTISEIVIGRLEEAGSTLLALGISKVGPRETGSQFQNFPVVHEAIESYGWTGAKMRPAVPEAAAIDRMDEALGWLEMIPADRYVLRRIVGARCLVSPLTGRRLFRWSSIARMLHANPRAVKRWHADGIGWICRGLRGREVAR